MSDFRIVSDALRSAAGIVTNSPPTRGDFNEKLITELMKDSNPEAVATALRGLVEKGSFSEDWLVSFLIDKMTAGGGKKEAQERASDVFMALDMPASKKIDVVLEKIVSLSQNLEDELTRVEKLGEEYQKVFYRTGAVPKEVVLVNGRDAKKLESALNVHLAIVRRAGGEGLVLDRIEALYGGGDERAKEVAVRVVVNVIPVKAAYGWLKEKISGEKNCKVRGCMLVSMSKLVMAMLANFNAFDLASVISGKKLAKEFVALVNEEFKKKLIDGDKIAEAIGVVAGSDLCWSGTWELLQELAVNHDNRHAVKVLAAVRREDPEVNFILADIIWLLIDYSVFQDVLNAAFVRGFGNRFEFLRFISTVAKKPAEWRDLRKKPGLLYLMENKYPQGRAVLRIVFGMGAAQVEETERRTFIDSCMSFDDEAFKAMSKDIARTALMMTRADDIKDLLARLKKVGAVETKRRPFWMGWNDHGTGSANYLTNGQSPIAMPEDLDGFLVPSGDDDITN